MSTPDPEKHARTLAAESLQAGDPTGWFERVYAEAEAGQAVVPWDRGEPHRMVVQWAQERGLRGGGRRAVVVGCGLGDDAEYIAGLGFQTVAFDIAPSAVEAARRRYPRSGVEYVTADLLDPPHGWRQAFDLVVESLTLQALPNPPRDAATRSLGQLVAPGGTLIVNARARDEGVESDEWPPWSLTRAEIDSLTGTGLEPVRIEDIHEPASRRWRAEYRRPGPSG